MNNDDKKYFIDKLDLKTTDVAKRINSNIWSQFVIIIASTSFLFFPEFSSSIEKRINVKLELTEIVIPFLITFLVLKFGHLNFLYIQHRQLQLNLIKELDLDLKILSRASVDKILRKQIFTEYWFRKLFISEYKFNIIPVHFLTAIVVIIVSTGQSLSIHFIIGIENIFVTVILFLILCLVYFIFYSQLWRSFNRRREVLKLFFMNIVMIAINYTILEVLLTCAKNP